MRRFLMVLALGAPLAACAEAPDAETEPDPIVPRKLLFDNPQRAGLQISPDGSRISFLAPDEGVLNVWVAPADQPEAAKAVTKDRKRGVRVRFWAYTNQHIVYLQDEGGDENWQVHVVDLDTGEDRNLTPFEEIPGPDGKPLAGPDGKKLRPTAQIQQVSEKFPTQILVGLNNRDPQFHDIYRVDLASGKMELVQKNEGFLGFVSDDDYNIRFAQRLTPDGGFQLQQPDGQGGWKDFLTVSSADTLTTSAVGFDKSGQKLLMIDSRGRNTAALNSLDLQTGELTTLAEDPRADISDALVHPVEKNVQAVASTYLRTEWKVLDPAIADDLKYLESVVDGDLNINGRSLDDKTWAVAYVTADGPVRYYLYDREARSAKFLFTNRPALESVKLAPMLPVEIKSRDGLNLVSYLTLPRWTDLDADGKPASPLPMVLFVHGGPWSRDDWGFDPFHQWLANRGYAVLSVNYRGSTGLGKDFINASNMEWAGKMHDDLIDAVNWAVETGVAQKDKVAIMGGSYGGYATLVGLTFTPDVFACGVDIVGPSNLRTLLNTIPPYWKPLMELWATRVGDPRTEDGQKFLDSRSPLTYVGKIQKPLLIAQGANDPRVKQSESDQIVKAMQEKGIPVTYVLYPDEGHGFARPENNLSFTAVADLFLSQHLGGRSEPVGEDFKGSSLKLEAGADQIPGLPAPPGTE